MIKLKRIISYTSILGAILVAAAPQIATLQGISAILPDPASLFPHLAELYDSVEALAKHLIPDEIEELVALISKRLN